MHRRAVAGEHAPHGVAVHVQLPRDGAHAPLLHHVQAQDLRHQVRGYGHGAAVPAHRGARSPDAAPWAAWGGLIFALLLLWGIGLGISLLSLVLMLSGLPFYRRIKTAESS